jgi:hypothetical protein
MQAAVVTQVEWQISEFRSEPCAMVMSIALPLSIIHAEPVHKHQELVTRRHLTVLLEYARGIVDVDPTAVMTQAHIDSKRVFGP